jgi:hypothetical protein
MRVNWDSTNSPRVPSDHHRAPLGSPACVKDEPMKGRRA